MNRNKRILLIEDNPTDRELITAHIADTNFSVDNLVGVSRLKEGIQVLLNEQVDVILLDLSLPDSFGLAGLKELAELQNDVPIIVLTVLHDKDMALEAIKCGAQDFLEKGRFNAYTLQKVILYSLERMEIIQKMVDRKQRLHQLVKTMNEGLVQVDRNDNIKFTNPCFCQLMGYSQEELIDQNFVEVLNLNTKSTRDIRKNTRLRLKGQSSQYEIECRRRDGSEIWFLVSSSPVYDHKQNIIGSLAVLSDITAQKRHEQDLVNIIFQAQERERKRIAQDLHDGLGQWLSGLKLHLSRVLKKDKKLGRELINIAQEAISEYRAVSHNLMPPALSELGLSEALAEVCERIGAASEFEVRYNLASYVNRLPRDMELDVFRIAQEVINNAIKYADPNVIEVQLNCEADRICLVVIDDGKGFDVTKAIEKDGIGLRNIRMRADVLKAKLQIKSEPGQGTIVKLCLRNKNSTPDAVVETSDQSNH